MNNFEVKHTIVKKIAIFASGRGSNAQKIIDFFNDSENIAIKLIVSNKITAPVLDLAEEKKIASHVLTRDTFYKKQTLLKQLAVYDIDFIVLAGFMWLIPPYLVKAYHNKIVNIHPALLPKYGGKGMYGMYVHKAVHKAGEKESGITIHYVNEEYDEGNIIFQASCPINSEDQPKDIAKKVLKLEHEHFAAQIEKLLTD